MDRAVESILFKPHDSNFLAVGNRIKEISNAKHKGIIIGFAKTIMANNPNVVAIA
jgi:hypothetical protein